MEQVKASLLSSLLPLLTLSLSHLFSLSLTNLAVVVVGSVATLEFVIIVIPVITFALVTMLRVARYCLVSSVVGYLTDVFPFVCEVCLWKKHTKRSISIGCSLSMECRQRKSQSLPRGK